MQLVSASEQVAVMVRAVEFPSPRVAAAGAGQVEAVEVVVVVFVVVVDVVVVVVVVVAGVVVVANILLNVLIRKINR